MSEIAVRPLRTAFDPLDGPVSVATPSCCCSCCCCCCLATTVATVSASASAAQHVAIQHESGSGGATFLGLMAVPAAIGMMFLLARGGVEGNIVLYMAAAAVTFIAVMALAFLAGGATGQELAHKLGIGVLLISMFLALFWIEVIFVVFTAGLIELLALGAPVFGWRVGKWWAQARPEVPEPR